MFHSAVLSLVIAVAGVSSAWSDTLYVADQLGGAIQTYDAATGEQLNPSFITGLDNPMGLTIAGSVLYVSDYTEGSVRAYNVTTGAEISGFSLQGLSGVFDTFVSGTTLYASTSSGVGIYNAQTGASINPDFISAESSQGIVVNDGVLLVCKSSDNVVATYDAATGGLINASFITGLGSPASLAVEGNTLYVSEIAGGRVGAYDVRTGAALYPNLVSPLSSPIGLAVNGNTLYVSTADIHNDDRVNAYDATTGEQLPLNEFLPIIEVSSVGGLAVLSSVPEPGTMSLLGLAVVGYGVFWRCRVRRA